ncbi:hypothetical protein [Halorientalis persicus]|uniref:hypothetical protein n=1 Tax=Halorientalis persicus TaxID=1367881 RepID=UPI0014806B25|nr:hypothetical protein [Halorientalis persicus]
MVEEKHGRSVFVTAVGVATAFSDRKHVEILLTPSSTTPETKRADSELLVWRNFERFEIIHWVTLLI